MINTKYKCTFLMLPLLLSCQLRTTVTGELFLSNEFKLVQELCEDEQVCLVDLYGKTSMISFSDDNTCQIRFKNASGDLVETKNGEYYLKPGRYGHSGEGYLYFDGLTIDVIFKESFFIIFETPSEWLDDESLVRTLKFQRWGS